MEKETNRIPKTGVAVMVMKDSKVLLARRKKVDGAGEFAFPGGHLEFGETLEVCAIRETMEEAGIEISNVQFQFVANLTRPDMHYLHVGMVADWLAGEPHNMEPEKSEEWKWYELDALPVPTFVMCVKAVESYRTGRAYFGAVN